MTINIFYATMPRFNITYNISNKLAIYCYNNIFYFSLLQTACKAWLKAWLYTTYIILSIDEPPSNGIWMD